MLKLPDAFYFLDIILSLVCIVMAVVIFIFLSLRKKIKVKWKWKKLSGVGFFLIINPHVLILSVFSLILLWLQKSLYGVGYFFDWLGDLTRRLDILLAQKCDPPTLCEWLLEDEE